MTKKLRMVAVAGALAALAAGAVGTAYAYGDVDVEVTVSGNMAYGSIGTARASASYQYIGCYIGSWTTYQVAACRARTPAGTYRSCSTQNEQLIETIAAMPSDAYLAFIWDTTSGECTYVYTDNTSLYRPR